MVKVTFKNLEKSSLAKNVVVEKISVLIGKFPELEQHSISLTLSMDNSSIQAGPDEFGVKVQIQGKKFEGLIVEKKARTLYLAMADVHEVLLELLNRRTDKLRVKSRTQLRKAKNSNEAQAQQDTI